MSELKIANRFLSGILTLIFSILFAFVFVEERQRGLAIVIAIPLAISLIWYAYSRFIDSDRPKEKTEYTGIKKIMAIFAALAIISTVASYTTKSRISIVLVILFLILLIIYEIIEVSHPIKWCGCGDELRSEEDIKTGICWICRSLINEPEQKTESKEKEVQNG